MEQMTRELESALTHSGVLLPAVLMPALQHARVNEYRVPIKWQMVQLAARLAQYTQTHNGQWPSDLKEMGLEETQIRDPFAPNGEPFGYEIRQDGAVAISHRDTDGTVGDDQASQLRFILYPPGKNPVQ